MRSPHLYLAKKYWKEHLKPESLVIDATLGNGHDTLFLSELVSEIYAIDIQKCAIESAKKHLLEKNVSLDKIHFIEGSHEDLSSLPTADLVIYNLGYLPGGDKSITTKTNSSLLSVKSALKRLRPKGAISIMCYPGHLEGEKEEEALMRFLETLDSQEFQVCHHRFVNRPKSASLFWITSSIK